MERNNRIRRLWSNNDNDLFLFEFDLLGSIEIL
jgi:hypothetical protein